MKRTIKIMIKGQLDESWKEWFEGLEIMREGTNTILYGNACDEAFVHGILNKIRDLNLRLISLDITEESNNIQDKNSKSES